MVRLFSCGPDRYQLHQIGFYRCKKAIIPMLHSLANSLFDLSDYLFSAVKAAAFFQFTRLSTFPSIKASRFLTAKSINR